MLQPTGYEEAVWLYKFLEIRVLSVNSGEGYYGHAIVVFDYSNDSFIIHDPGPPPIAHRVVGFKNFIDAWGDGDPTSPEMDAIKLEVKK